MSRPRATAAPSTRPHAPTSAKTTRRPCLGLSVPAPTLRPVAQRYDDRYFAAVWAMRCQQGDNPSPIAIRRALARDKLGLGYAVDVPKRTMQDHLRNLERRHGKPRAQVKAGEEDSAMAQVKREAIAAIQRTVQVLSAKQDAGTITKGEMGTLSVALKAAEDYERRREADKIRAGKHSKATERAAGGDAKAGGPSALMDRLTNQLKRSAAEGPVSTGPGIQTGEGVMRDAQGKTRSEEPAQTVDHARSSEAAQQPA